MRICARCSFKNSDLVPTCIWCNASLVDVRPVPSEDLPEEESKRESQALDRQRIRRRHLRFAALCYGAAITLLAVNPGFIWQPVVLGLFAGSGLLVGAIIIRFNAYLWAIALQLGLSLAVLLGFGPFHPGSFLMLLGHTILPMLMHHWVTMIYDMNR